MSNEPVAESITRLRGHYLHGLQEHRKTLVDQMAALTEEISALDLEIEHVTKSVAVCSEPEPEPQAKAARMRVSSCRMPNNDTIFSVIRPRFDIAGVCYTTQQLWHTLRAAGISFGTVDRPLYTTLHTRLNQWRGKELLFTPRHGWTLNPDWPANKEVFDPQRRLDLPVPNPPYPSGTLVTPHPLTAHPAISDYPHSEH